MFGWLKDLINGITSAISDAFSGIGQEITSTIWSTMLEWFYETVYSAVGDFFSMMGNMGAQIFDLKWVQATVHLFSLFGWGLFIAGTIVAVFDLAIEYQNGRGNVRNTILNILKGFLACSLISTVPISEQEEQIASESQPMVSVAPIKKVSFAKKILNLSQEYQNYFVSLHNELISYKKVHSRISIKCASYRLGRKLLAKITVRGKTLKLYLALKIDDFNKNVYFQKDASDVKAYEEVPFSVKVKSARAEKNARKLIQALMQEVGAVKNEKHIHVNIIRELLSNESVENNNASAFSNATKKTFSEKLASLDSTVQGYYSTISKEFVSYKKVNERLSNKHVTYRKGRKLLAKMTIRGKTLKLHLALDVAGFNKNVFFQKDMSSVKAYEEVPFTVKVKSARAEKNAVKLINELMLINGAVKKQEK